MSFDRFPRLAGIAPVNWLPGSHKYSKSARFPSAEGIGPLRVVVRELPQLTIGNSAVALYEEDIERFRRMMKEMATDGPEGGLDDALYRGELQQLDDAHADRLVKAFFMR